MDWELAIILIFRFAAMVGSAVGDNRVELINQVIVFIHFLG